MRRLPPLLLILIVGSCNDPATAPGREIVVAFCAPPHWAAYRNEGQPWRRLELPFGVVGLTERVAIATVRMSPGPIIEVSHLTSDQVERAYRCPAGGDVGKTVHANVSGLDAGDEVYAMLGSSIAFRQNVGVLTFLGVPPGPQDLVAARHIFERDRVRVPGVIVRRAQDIPFGASLASLDFASAEAVVPLEHTITFTETTGTTSRGLQVDFITASGARVPIGGAGTGTTATGWSLPPSTLATGDLHLMHAGGVGLGFARSLLLFYRNGADWTLSLGPQPSAPVFMPPPAGAVVRANVTSQPEYAARVSLHLSTGGRSVTLQATGEYFGGTPVTWTLDVPDLRGVPGFQDSWQFSAGNATWALAVTGQPYDFNVRNARDGDVYRTAHLSGPEVQLPMHRGKRHD